MQHVDAEPRAHQVGGACGHADLDLGEEQARRAEVDGVVRQYPPGPVVERVVHGIVLPANASTSVSS